MNKFQYQISPLRGAKKVLLMLFTAIIGFYFTPQIFLRTQSPNATILAASNSESSNSHATETNPTTPQTTNSVNSSSIRHHENNASVLVQYVDQNGTVLASEEASYPQGAFQGKSYQTQPKSIKNFKYVGLSSHSLPANGILKKAGINGTVIYTYAPGYQVKTKTIHENIHYVNQNGKKLAPDRTSNTVTFLTVTNPKTKLSKTYYSFTDSSAQLDSKGVPLGATWHPGKRTTFASVPHPKVNNYAVYSVVGSSLNKKEISVQPVDSNSADFNFTVIYRPISITFQTVVLDDNSHKTLLKKKVTLVYKANEYFDFYSIINHYQKMGYRLIGHEPSRINLSQVDADSKTFYIHLTSLKPDKRPKKSSTKSKMINRVASTPKKTSSLEQQKLIKRSSIRRAYFNTKTTRRSISAIKRALRSPLETEKYHIKIFPEVQLKLRQSPIPSRLLPTISLLKSHRSGSKADIVFDDWIRDMNDLFTVSGGHNATQLGAIFKSLSGTMLIGH